jgi:peptide/nickel transport system ATP-binding protein
MNAIDTTRTADGVTKLGATQPILQVQNLCATYRTNRQAIPAVNSVTFTLYQGERLGIVGESGSGKSSLALALLRLHKPPTTVDGTVTFAGGSNLLALSAREMKALRWRDLALIPQGAMNSLNPVMKVKHQLRDVFAAHQKGWSAAQVNARIEEMLRLVGLSGSVGDLYPHELSGGMKQRVCIAMAILLEPKVIIADEPTSALDVVVQRLIMQTLRQVQAQLGSAVIIIGHDMGLMAQFVDRLAVMYAGKLVEIAPVKPFYRTPLHPYSQSLIAAVPSTRRQRVMTGLPGSQPPLTQLPTGCAFHPRCPIAVERCRREVPPLREVGPQRWAACHLVEVSPHG